MSAAQAQHNIPTVSSLQTPNPFHIPGYSGYIPQQNYKCGAGFSAETHRLLSNPNVHKSGNSVLTHTSNKIRSTEEVLQETRHEIMKTRTASWGDQKFRDPMVPGYTGEIPRLQNYCGKTYANSSFQAITEFENSQRLQQRKSQELRLIGCLQTGAPLPQNLDGVKLPSLRIQHRMPLQKVRQDMAEYQSPNPFTPTQHVYKLPLGDKDKVFISGYMGFVPRAHEFYGKDYENITRSALNEFTDEMERRKVVLSEPVQIERPSMRTSKDRRVVIYPEDAGLKPKYTGHVPAYVSTSDDIDGRTFFDVGETVGHLTPQCF